MITIYNATKGFVDTMDKKTENSTMAWQCIYIGWQLEVFFIKFYIGRLNAQIIFQENTTIEKQDLYFLRHLHIS